VNDLLDPSQRLRIPGKEDVVNFGFEVSLDLLQDKRHLLNEEALVLAPLSSEPGGSLEQSYSLLEYKNGAFTALSEIMKTSFSLRVDKQRQVNESLDNDYFATHQRHEKLVRLKAEIAILEERFLQLRKQHGDARHLSELVRVPEIKQVLADLGDRKKKA
jgi:hypothetical protein